VLAGLEFGEVVNSPDLLFTSDAEMFEYIYIDIHEAKALTCDRGN